MRDETTTVTTADGKQEQWGGRATGGLCTLDSAYVAAYQAAQNVDAGTNDAAPNDAGSSRPCPTYTAPIKGQCQHICGRPFDGYECRPHSSTLQDYLVSCMHLEAASVAAFVQLEEELRALGAPASLLAACRKAAADETRHAQAMGALVNQTPPALHAPPSGRRAFEIALENVRVGMVRETYGAVLAHVQTLHATEEGVRNAMKVIASEESEHAALSVAVDAFLRTLLDSEECARLDAAKRAEVTRLRAELAQDPPDELRTRGGMPSALLAKTLLDELDLRVWSQAA